MAAIFLDEVNEVALDLRNALVAAFDQVGVDPATPSSASKVLGLDKSLASNICRFARSNSPATDLPFYPGVTGENVILRALALHGANTAAVQACSAKLDDVTRRYAGDRRGLHQILGSIDTGSVATKMQRRQGISAMTSILGVRAKGAVRIHAFYPANNGSEIHAAGVFGLVGLERLRSENPWPLATMAITLAGKLNPNARIEPLAKPIHGVPLLEEFSSKPAPELAVRQLADGRTRFDFVPGIIGRSGAVSAFLGFRVVDHSPMAGPDRVQRVRASSPINTPVKRFTFDVLYHKDIPFTSEPVLTCFSTIHGPVNSEAEAEYAPRIPIVERAVELHENDSPGMSWCPGYPGLLRTTVQATGFEMRDFRRFRVELEEPPLPATLWLVRNVAEMRSA